MSSDTEPKFKLYNSTASVPKNLFSEPFTLKSSPGTDIWRIPRTAGGRNDFTGPVLSTRMPLSSFQSASVTVSADWKSQYAQGGLVFFLPDSSFGDGEVTRDPIAKELQGEGSQGNVSFPWIKTGIEFENEETFASVVTARPWSDWSLGQWGEETIKVDMSREKDGLWIVSAASIF
jgi:uncharacterized protein